LVLTKSLRRLLLEACSTPCTAQQLAQRVGTVDVVTVRNELVWTARYDDETLRESAFLTPIRLDQVDHLVATIRPPSFLADPLLTALVTVPAQGKPLGAMGPSPQRPQGFPMADLLNAKLIDGH